MWKLKTLRTLILLVLGGVTWEAIISWPNWLILAILILDLACVVATAIVTNVNYSAMNDRASGNTK